MAVEKAPVWTFPTNPKRLGRWYGKGPADRLPVGPGPAAARRLNGAKIIPEKSVRPLNRPARTRATAAKVPSTVAMVAEIRPIRKVTQMASRSCSLRNSEAYHLVEKPPQTVTSRLALNE